MNSIPSWKINISLCYLGSVLTRVDVTLSDVKGAFLYISLEHPLSYFYRTREFLPKISSQQQLNLIESSEEHCGQEPKQTIGSPIIVEDKKAVKLLYGPHQHKLDDLLQRIEEGLTVYEPETCYEGVNGTYFLKDKSGKFIAVFKPEDEEANSANNKKSSPEKEDKLASLKFLKSGEASRREVAAYLVDREGFFGVPRTTLVSIEHPKFNGCVVGSIQEFVETDGASWDIGPSFFPIKEVHKIGILDLYMLNFDRHGGNMLYKEEDGSLFPIDNGFSLPDDVAVPNLWFEWLNFPQSKKPFDPETRAFIERLDPDHDITMLKKELGIRDECLRVMKVSASLLKKAAAVGLTLHEIGNLVCRTDPDAPSYLEILYKNAQSHFSGRNTLIEAEEKVFRDLCEAELDLLVSKKGRC